MKAETWRGIGRWLLALIVSTLSFLPALIILELAPGLEKAFMLKMDALRPHTSPEISLGIFGAAIVAVALGIWIGPSAFAIGFALRSGLLARIQWGLSLILILTSVLLWVDGAPGLQRTSKLAAVAVPAMLLTAIVISLALKRTTIREVLAIPVAMLLLAAPYCFAFAQAPPQPPEARKLWTVTLQKQTWQGMNTGSAYNSRRQVVFAGDRLLVSFDSGSAPYEGQQPMARYRLLSLDLKNGAILNMQEFIGKWGHVPLLYATSDGHVILQYESLKSVNPDLTDAGPAFSASRGRVEHMSPDGSTMVWETWPGSILLDSHSLAPFPRHLDESVPTSISKRGVLTDNIYWTKDYPNDRVFVTLTDGAGKHLLFHGECGGRPEFLSNEKVLVAGCGKVRIIDIHGNLLHETKTAEGTPNFAGVSRDGRSFAIEFSEVRGDPPMPLYDHFMIFDTETAQPVAMVRIMDLPEYYSWSALSPDGKLFAAGNPNDLSLYELP
jgi:multisubunit Na+/H+ antiporter MnhC subunit